MEDLATTCDTQSASNELERRVPCLNAILYENRALETMLALPSLNVQLSVAMEERRHKQNGEYFREHYDSVT